MRVYISGAIAGKPDGNRPLFQQYEEYFTQGGHEVVNPHKVDHAHEGPCHGKSTERPGDPHKYGCYLLADIKALSNCEAIFMLPGWQGSRGARTEHAYATACGLPFILVP